MSDPMEKSMQGTSQFIAFEESMEKSMCGVSQKLKFDNASRLNREELQKDLKAYKKLKNQSIKQQQYAKEEQENEFLNVGKWNKSKKSDVKSSLLRSEEQIEPSSNKNLDASKKSEISSGKASHESSKWDRKPQTGSKDNRASQQGTGQRVEERKPFLVGNNSFKKPINSQTNEYTLSQKKDIFQNKKQQEKKVIQPESKERQQEDLQEEQQEQQEQQDEEQQEEQEQDEEQQQQEEEDEEDEEEEEDEQQQDQQQEQDEIEDNSGVEQQSQKSSHAYKTQTVNTSALNETGKPGKWNKKKSPLQTLTKYETEKEKEDKKQYHSRLNSADIEYKDEQIGEDIIQEGNQEWCRVEKILLRLKLML